MAAPPAVAGASLPVRWKSVKATNMDRGEERFPKDGIMAIGCHRNIWIRVETRGVVSFGIKSLAAEAQFSCGQFGG